MKLKQLAGCFLTLAIITLLVALSSVNLFSALAEAPDATPTPCPPAEVVMIDVISTPEPEQQGDSPTAPPETPTPVFVLSGHKNDAQEIEVAAKSAYRSPFTQLYWKFVLWSTEYNRSISPSKIDGFWRYARTFVGVATDKDEYFFWSAENPRSKKGEELLRLNRIAADLFFDYIKSTTECGTAPMVPYDGVLLEFVKDEDGMNRSARVYDLDGNCLELMSEVDFNDTIGREYARRLNGTE